MASLPMPSSEQLFPAGGQLVRTLGGINALNRSNIENQYLPLTTQAEAASKLAYANLMGPQFLAKLMGNPDIVANMTPEQRNKALQATYQAGSGQGTGANALANPALNEMLNPQNNNPLAQIINKIRGAFGFGGGQQQPQNALAQQPQQQGQMSPGLQQQNLSPQDQQNMNRMQPGDAYQIQGANSGMSFDRNGNNVVASPQQIQQAVDRGNVGENTYAENAGRMASIKKEMGKLGELRGEDINNMDKQYTQAVNVGVPMKHLMDMAISPTFMNMRNKIPFFQDKQLQLLSKTGTPEEQKMIGDFITSTKRVVADTITGFPGRILDKEVNLANQMKINDNDTWNVMMGKLASLETFNEMTKQRTREVSRLMAKEHMNLGEAQEIVDKQIDGDAIRKQVESQLNPKPEENDIKYMMDKYGYDRETVMKKLKAKGHM